MGLTVIKPGIQATLQAAPRMGLRHLGIPASGPADPLSMALANRLVGNLSTTPALELPLGLASFRTGAACHVALTGARAPISIDGSPAPMHRTLEVGEGQEIAIGATEAGARVYLAIAGGFVADDVLGSASTCLPAGFGGHHGRALKAGDHLAATPPEAPPQPQETPQALRQVLSHSFALRCVPGPDARLLAPETLQNEFVATRRADRIGIELTGPWPRPENGAQKPSAPVFPGAVQLTPSGNAFVLLPDSQTTGGYPHVLQVTRADRHLLGQVRPGDRIRFLMRTPDEAAEDLRRKTAFLRSWLPDLQL